jgi:hypothetical protein
MAIAKTQLTQSYIHVIAEAIGAEWVGGVTHLANWKWILEHAAYEGFDVSSDLERLNAIPERAPFEPIELLSLDDRLKICDLLDRHTADGTYREKFNADRSAVKEALTAYESGKVDVYVFGCALSDDPAYKRGWADGMKEAEANRQANIDADRGFADYGTATRSGI